MYLKDNIFIVIMDLLGQIELRKKQLKSTKTILTSVTGERYEIFNGKERKLTERCLPYVVDDKPDMQIVRITEGLFLSSQDPVNCPELLKNHRINHVLSVGVKIFPTNRTTDINYYFLEFLDLPEFDITEVLKKSFDIINRCKFDNILVHCNAGVSRSATIVIGYLMAVENLNYNEAYERVKIMRNCIKPNDGFSRQLKSLTNIQNMISN